MFLRSFFFFIAVIVSSTQTFTFAASTVLVKDLRSWQAPDHTRLVFDLSRKTEHTLFPLDNPNRLVIDIDKARLANENIIGAGLQPPVTAIRHGNHEHSLRLVIDLSREVQARSFLLEPTDNYGYRLVIDMYTSAIVAHATEEDITAEAVINEDESATDWSNRDIVIAIDAGHGGDDTGAIAKSGIKEKDLVLKYSKLLEKKLDAIAGIDARLTRKSDYFIGLRKRNKLAHDFKADLFISVHANSFPYSNTVGGFMLFALSNEGATSETGRWLAKSENKSDAIGGTDALPLDGKSRELKKVLIDLSMTSVLNHSIFAGKEILKSVGKKFKLHSKKVELANFTVLRSPDIPALLLELGFLSNPMEAKKLASTAFREKMVGSIAQGITSYLNAYPPYGSTFANRKILARDIYTVVSGDTLSEIAERFEVDVAKVRRMNGLDGNYILVGQKLKLFDFAQTSGSNQEYYTVQYGDTLSEIALRFGISIDILQKLNDLNNSTIRSGQKIWLHKQPEKK